MGARDRQRRACGERPPNIGGGQARALRGATLALIVERPGHGYDLAARLSHRLGPAWRISAKQLYPILQQLERDGLATCAVERNPQRPRQDRFVYRATEQAPEALARWMESAVRKEPLRGDLHARIAVSKAHDAPKLLKLLDDYEAELIGLIEETTLPPALAHSWDGLHMSLTHDHADAHLKAELSWLVEARRRIREFTTQQPR